MRLIAFLLLLVAFYAGGAETPSLPIIPDQWDSISCGLGIVESDYYVEECILIVRRNGNGADLIINAEKRDAIGKSIDREQLAALVKALEKLFSGAKHPNAGDPDEPVPKIFGIIQVDNLLRRSSYHTTFASKDGPDDYVKLLQSLEK